MRNSIIFFIVGMLFIVLADSVYWILIRQYLHKKWQKTLYWLLTLFFVVNLSLFKCFVSRLNDPKAYFWISLFFGLVVLRYVPQWIFMLFYGLGCLLKKWSHSVAIAVKFFAKALSCTLFVILAYSLTWGRYNYKIETVEIPLSYLPATFQDFKIVQLTDIHLGSYGKNYPGISRLVKEVNALQPDLVVFTGDMVNNFADEMKPWIDVLSRIEAKYGKYAVTGNHDYGNYTSWPSPEAKAANMRQFYENMEIMGFHMLRNAHVPIVRQGDTLWLAGVDNWGNPPFPRYGKLNEAIDSIPSGHPTILLSHDPSHWRAEVLRYPVDLTLSGHTHAMQMGIKIGQHEWSPAQHLYPEYDGLYRQDDRYLYVGRGQGYLGFPGRIGLRPLIPVLTLTR